MNYEPIRIGDKETSVPIIQGGMGVGVSLSGLASAVANCGGIGVISGVQIGFREDDFERNSEAANVRAMIQEINRARELSPKGIIGINLMVAIKNYGEMALAAAEAGVDLIISGAGLPSDLPKFIKGTNTKIAPIVSSGKAAALITKLWKRRYDYYPDLIIVEGPEAGGHLGFSFEELENAEEDALEKILLDVIQAIKPFEKERGIKIPIIAAGGIYDGKDIAKFLKLGASGVQMGTRFVATEECDATNEYKESYIEAKQEDIKLVLSPVGMPGRAINNSFIKRAELGRIKVEKCYLCLTPCKPATTPYCISTALINSVSNNINNGLIFIGSCGYKLEKIGTVSELIHELVEDIKRS
jgi:NAD(P)H-dependent flavin oxidoreductase YrpB (nitropropane dioxygenase family)